MREEIDLCKVGEVGGGLGVLWRVVINQCLLLCTWRWKLVAALTSCEEREREGETKKDREREKGRQRGREGERKGEREGEREMLV